MTSPLLIVLAGRGDNHWVMASLTFIQRIRSHSIQLEWGIVGVTYKLLGDFGYSHSSLAHWIPTYLHPTSFIVRILLSLRLIKVRHILSSVLGMFIVTWWDNSDALTTWAENINPVGLGKKYLIPSHLQE